MLHSLITKMGQAGKEGVVDGALARNIFVVLKIRSYAENILW